MGLPAVKEPSSGRTDRFKQEYGGAMSLSKNFDNKPLYLHQESLSI